MDMRRRLGDVKPANNTFTCSVWAIGSSITVVKPVPAELTAGTSFAPERLAANVIGAAYVAGPEEPGLHRLSRLPKVECKLLHPDPTSSKTSAISR